MICEDLRVAAASHRARWALPGGIKLKDNLHAAARRFSDRQIATLLEALALAKLVDSIATQGTIDVASLPDPVVEAFHKAYPHVDLQSIDGAGADSIQGYINAWRGKLFEITVRDELNAGYDVDGVSLEPGQTAELAVSATQPGWDIAIVNDDGTVVGTIQLKATTSAAYVNEALERYPDIPIVTTSDVAGHFADHHAVAATDISTADLSNHIGLDATDHVIDASDALLPASVIVATELLAVATGAKSAGRAVQSAVGRAAISAVAATVGGVVHFFTGGLLGGLAALGVRLWLGSRGDRSPELPALPAPGPGTSKARAAQRFDTATAETVSFKEVVNGRPAQSPTESCAGISPISRKEFLSRLELFRRRYPVASDKPAQPQQVTHQLQAASKKLWFGTMRGTSVPVVYDPALQDERDRQVWVYLPQGNRIRAWRRDDLRTRVVAAPLNVHDELNRLYAAWRRVNGDAVLRHIRSYAFVDDDRPAFVGAQ